MKLSHSFMVLIVIVLQKSSYSDVALAKYCLYASFLPWCYLFFGPDENPPTSITRMRMLLMFLSLWRYPEMLSSALYLFIFPNQEDRVEVKVEEVPAPLTQLAHSSTLEHEVGFCPNTPIM